MVRIELGVEDLANMRFGISPLSETVRSLRALSDPAQHTLHLPWLRAIQDRLDAADLALLQSLIGPSRIPVDYSGTPSRAIADFLTPLPMRFIERFEDELARIRQTPPAIARRDLLASHAPDRVPDPLRPAERRDRRTAIKLLNAICDGLERYWHIATPGAASQHLQVLHNTGLLTRARDRRQVLYRRSPLGDQLTASPPDDRS